MTDSRTLADTLADLAARGRQADPRSPSAQIAVNGLCWAYQLMIDRGADRLDVLRLTSDAIDVAETMNDLPLDLSGLEALKAKLEAETSVRVRMVRR